MALTHVTTTSFPIFEVLQSFGIPFKFFSGQNIFYEGMRPTGAFYIVKGRVKSCKTSSSGNEMMIGVSNSGCLIGYSQLMTKDFYGFNAIAIEKTDMLFIPREKLFKFMNVAPEVFEKIQKV